MSPWSILLRVLLSLCLAFNGAISAGAATSMHMEHAVAHAAPTSQPDVSHAGPAVAPCHHETGMAMPMAHDDAVAATASEKSKHPAPDCCKSGTCDCACTYVAQTAFEGQGIAAQDRTGTLGARRLSLGHATPALPHLIRPPIG